MTVDVEGITTDRLGTWCDDCIDVHATPALLLAIGHDGREGEVHVFVPSDILFDRKAIKDLLHLILSKL